MADQDTGDPKLKRQETVTVMIVVAIGYVATFTGSLIGATVSFTLIEAVIGVLLGIIYLILLINSDTYFRQFTSTAARVIYFITQLSLVFAIQSLLLGPGAWLIPLPLLGTVVEQLPSRWRWPIYVAIPVGMAIPVGVRTGDWPSALNTPLFLIPAVTFVVIVTQLRLNERQARQRAEELSTQLEAVHERLATYAIQAEELATTKERNRLAREIHDNLGHFLTVTNVQLEVARTVMESDPAKAINALNRAKQLTQEGLSAVRQSVAALRDSPIGGRSLPEAIGSLIEETSQSGIVTEFEVCGEHRSLGARTKLTLFRIAQEGLTNVRKHARASRVDVLLDYRDAERVRLRIKDNGIGTATIGGEGFGLIGIRERVLLLNGELLTETAPGQGFRLEAVVPG